MNRLWLAASQWILLEQLKGGWKISEAVHPEPPSLHVSLLAERKTVELWMRSRVLTMISSQMPRVWKMSLSCWEECKKAQRREIHYFTSYSSELIQQPCILWPAGCALAKANLLLRQGYFISMECRSWQYYDTFSRKQSKKKLARTFSGLTPRTEPMHGSFTHSRPSQSRYVPLI